MMDFGDDRSKRKYVCFCCGIQFDSPSNYRDHIIEKHEEGRDYVLCPFEHCNYPVRCVASHCKAKHSGMPIPKKGMMKAIVWKDFNQKGGKPKTRKPRFREGFFESIKMGKQMHYRSGMEAKIYECLEADNEVIAYEVEPFEIQYIHQGNPHRYIPDILIRYTSGKTELAEIKPSAQTSLEKNKDKWHAAEKACETRGWEFVVITEVGLDKLKAKVKRQFEEAKFGT